MRKFGLIGYPLGHSFSKQYFAEKFRREAISDAVYDNYPLPAIEELPGLIRNTEGLAGLNVTIPHKISVMKFLTAIDDEASSTGAVNVIKTLKSSSGLILKGFNTDIYGFRESLVPNLKARKYSALILGTGGSSLAIGFVLSSLGIPYLNVSRSGSAGSISYNDLTDSIVSSNKLIINTTPLGMFPDTGSFPDINYNMITKDHILFDLIYNPEMTRFLSMGKERGSTVIGGLRMLHLQAEKSWEIWNDDSL